jgi:molecular chaperone GrpE (heat shock protein)
VGKEISYGVGLLFAKLTGRAQAFKTTQKAAAKAAYAKASARTNEYMAEQKAKAESLRTKFAKTADKTRGKMISDINQSFAKTIDELDSAVAEFTRTDSQTSSLPLSTAPSSMAKKDQ